MTNEQCLLWLPQARAALHELRLGRTIVSVSYGDRRVQYSQSSIKDLYEYVNEMEALCGDGGKCAGGGPRRPFGVIW